MSPSRPSARTNGLLEVWNSRPIVARDFCRSRDRDYLPRSCLEPSITLCLLSDLATILTFSEHEARGMHLVRNEAYPYVEPTSWYDSIF